MTRFGHMYSQCTITQVKSDPPPPPFTFNNSQKHCTVLSQQYHIHTIHGSFPPYKFGENPKSYRRIQNQVTRPSSRPPKSLITYLLSRLGASCWKCLLKTPLRFQTSINRCNKPHVKTLFKR